MGFAEFFSTLKDLITVMAPLVPVLIGLVEFYRLLGLPSDGAAMVACVVTGIVLALAIQAAITFPVAVPWLLAGLVGAITGMTATGLYTVGNRWADKVGGVRR
jgi:hypothetical protein